MHQTKLCSTCKKPVHFDIGLVLPETVLCADCSNRQHAARLAVKPPYECVCSYPCGPHLLHCVNHNARREEKAAAPRPAGGWREHNTLTAMEHPEDGREARREDFGL